MRHSVWMSEYQCEIEDNPARRSVEKHSSRLKQLSVLLYEPAYQRLEHLDSQIFRDKLYAEITKKNSEVTG